MSELDKTIKHYEKRVLELSNEIVSYTDTNQPLGFKELENLYTLRIERGAVVDFLERLYDIKFNLENI